MALGIVMNWKIIVLGGLAFYVATFAVSMITGQVIHTGILEQDYKATAEFWRPELNQVPPDMTALLPLWIFNGLVMSFVAAAVYNWIRPALGVTPWKKGLSFGVIFTLFAVSYNMGYSGVFNLPEKIWFWWSVDALIIYLIGGVVLGLVAEKLAPQ